jgi:nucleotide-binding universal stress UspA family protein
VQAAREATEKVISELDGPHPTDVAVRGVSGIVVPELLSASQDADLLVLGARGGGGFHALRLGGVSSQLVGHASCPVAVVPA